LGKKMETKSLKLDALELKFVGEDMVFAGYASVFGGVDAYGDTIDPKAYDATLIERSRPVRMRWNHYGPIIGKWLDIRTDSKGLYVNGQLTPGHSTAIDVYASMKHGTVDGMSIGYIPRLVEETSAGRRLLKQIDLIEISVVEEPADLGAKIESVKSVLDECATLKDIENLLREASGFSKSDATALVGRIRRLALGEQVAAEEKAKAEMLALFQNHQLNISI
jgi:HK97 family phage prohead protease